MKPQTIGLCLIVKDEEANIERALSSVIEQVDHVYITDTGSTDNTIPIAKAVCKMYDKPLSVSNFKWINNFAAARNFNFEQAKTDWILWIDGDDSVEGSENLKPLVQRAYEMGFTGLHFTYRYEVDKNNRDVVTHPKLRVIRREMYEWFRDHAQVHENLVILDKYNYLKKESLETLVKIRHWATHEDLIKSGKRNLAILKEMEVKERAEGKIDPRTLFLLGRESHAQGIKDEAVKYLKEFIESEGSNSEKLEACGMIGDVYRSKGDYKTFLEYGYKAVSFYPNHPKGYIFIAQAYELLGKYKDAITWVGHSLTKVMDDNDAMVQSPKGVAFQQVTILVDAYCELKNFEKAEAILEKYILQYGDEGDLQTDLLHIKSQKQAQKIIDGFVRMTNTALKYGKLDKIKHLISTLPEEMLMKPEVINLKRSIGLNKVWSKGNIVIMCGKGHEEWHQDSLKEKGLGGSETAVIEIARRLGLRNYKITVYGSVEEKKVFGNVTYLPAEDFDPADEFDIFISWRNPLIFKYLPLQAKKKFLWLHDVPEPTQFTDEVLNSIDKIIVLTKFHRTFLPSVPEHKFYYSSNGIDVETIEEIEKEGIKRNPFKVIYASSPDRGMENLLNIWADVKKEVPQAELKLVYGWDTFDKLRSHDPHALEWKKRLQDKMKELGVEDTVRLTKKELYREYFSSGIWAYPTQFEEINCIVAQEAQACGCYPITTGYAALEEMQVKGIRTGYPLDSKFKEYLVRALKRDIWNDGELRSLKRGVIWSSLHGEEDGLWPTDEKQVNEIRRLFSWDNTVNNWAKDLFYGEIFEQKDPLVSVVCITIRPGPFRVLKETLEKQSYKNFELIVIDGRYKERREEVARYFEGFKHDFIHLPDPERDNKYDYGLYHADNAALKVCRGELVVFVQDFIEIPEDGIEKFVELYKNYPEAIYTGVDTRNAISPLGRDHDTEELPRSIDIFLGEDYCPGDVQFTSPRIRIEGARRLSFEPMEWELNYAAAPTKILKDLGGWDQDWDKAFGFDNTVLALRHVYKGGAIIVDETNKCTALSHWDLFGDNDSEGVPHRNKKLNDSRYFSYLTYLKQSDNAQVNLEFQEPKYPKDIKLIIKKWLNETN